MSAKFLVFLCYIIITPSAIFLTLTAVVFNEYKFESTDRIIIENSPKQVEKILKEKKNYKEILPLSAILGKEFINDRFDFKIPIFGNFASYISFRTSSQENSEQKSRIVRKKIKKDSICFGEQAFYRDF